MDGNRILVGSMIVALCCLLLWKERWFLENTRKGQRLVRWFGPIHGPKVLRGLTLAGIIFGALLSWGIIRPIQWK